MPKKLMVQQTPDIVNVLRDAATLKEQGCTFSNEALRSIL